jgi:hypothetical protein
MSKKRDFVHYIYGCEMSLQVAIKSNFMIGHFNIRRLEHSLGRRVGYWCWWV